MSRLIIFPYKIGSGSAKKIAEELDVLRVRADGRYRYRRGDLVVNWGNSRTPAWWTPDAAENTLNKPENVALAANKINTFETLTEAGVPTLEWTTSPTVANVWLDTKCKVFVRGVLNGHSGEGITILEQPPQDPKDKEIAEIADRLSELGFPTLALSVLDATATEDDLVEVPPAPLYTKGKENHGEYRVHVFGDEVIDYRKKSRRDGDPIQEGQGDVRTLANGWVFRQSNLKQLDRIKELAVNAITALGLDFGAVDIIKDEEGNVFVLEVNSAPACDDTTLQNYSVAINNYYASINQ